MKSVALGVISLFGLAFGVACTSNERPAGQEGSSSTGGSSPGASSGGSMGGTNGGRSSGEGGTAPADGGSDERVLITHPNPIISRSAEVFSLPAGAANTIHDGNYHNGGWTVPRARLPAWVAFKLSSGPTRILVSWDDGGTYNYQDPTTVPVYGLPASYLLDVSADSTNGIDGTWSNKVTVGDADGGGAGVNQVRTRAHSIDFAGMSWVRMTITAAPANESPNGIQIAEVDIHDTSSTAPGLPDDTWFFMGDSATAFAYDRAAAHQPSFAETVNTATPPFYPAMINGGIGGEKASDGLARLQRTLDLNPDYRFFTLAYGGNDAAGGQVPVARFRANMQTMIDMVKGAGRIPVIPHIPYAGDGTHDLAPAYNAVIDELVLANHLLVGPDLYNHLQQHPEEFICPPCGGGRVTDNVHPNDTGLTAMNRLWAQAMRPIYP